MITPLHRPDRGGFTLPEMIITVAALMVISGASVALSQVGLQREEINQVAVGLVDWLMVVQRGAQRTTTGCTVTFSSGASMAAGSVLAQVSPATCNPESSFKVAALSQSRTLSAAISSTPVSSTAGFTPRGTTTLASSMTLTLRQNGRPLTRCVRIQAVSGFLTVGSSNSGGACSEESFNESI
jgi:Tfp pilus assembly protein PilE